MKIKRLSFPSDEKIHPWLSMLLDAYHVVDRGVAKAIETEQKKGRKLACKKNCSNCCKTHKDIPVYPLELVGISWYAAEKMPGPLREPLRKQLRNHKKNSPCPFLLEQECSIHLVRPIACRQFNVFGKPCDEAEDPYYTRVEDVLPPVQKHIDQAFYIMFPFYGVEKESERIRAVENKDMHKMVTILQACSWHTLAEKMQDFDTPP